MRIAVMGSGGVGGFYGGRLAHAGYDVSFIARGAHLAALEEHGLEIESPPQDSIRVPRVRATDDPATIGIVDLVLTSSMHHDLERGNPLEVAWLSGGVVQLGEAVGVPTPANRAVWDILALHTRGRSAIRDS